MRQRGKTFEFKFMQINTREIEAADYQRIPDMKRVREIASKFDWNLVNVSKCHTGMDNTGILTEITQFWHVKNTTVERMCVSGAKFITA